MIISDTQLHDNHLLPYFLLPTKRHPAIICKMLSITYQVLIHKFFLLLLPHSFRQILFPVKCSDTLYSIISIIRIIKIIKKIDRYIYFFQLLLYQDLILLLLLLVERCTIFSLSFNQIDSWEPIHNKFFYMILCNFYQLINLLM